MIANETEKLFLKKYLFVTFLFEFQCLLGSSVNVTIDCLEFHWVMVHENDDENVFVSNDVDKVLIILINFLLALMLHSNKLP